MPPTGPLSTLTKLLLKSANTCSRRHITSLSGKSCYKGIKRCTRTECRIDVSSSDCQRRRSLECLSPSLAYFRQIAPMRCYYASTMTWPSCGDAMEAHTRSFANGWPGNIISAQLIIQPICASRGRFSSQLMSSEQFCISLHSTSGGRGGM